jgi:putative ABC transport system ATP-binding protein
LNQNPVIQVRQLTRRDRRLDRTILDQVDLSIAPGERIGLVGPSGSGKSSLLRTIAKLDLYDSGSINFHGAGVSPAAVPSYRRSVVYLSQQPMFRASSVGDNLELVFRLRAAGGSCDLQRARLWLDRLGKPASVLTQSIESLSGGEQQIISLIRALLLSPIVLLLDEPTAALDADSIVRFEQLVNDWHSSKLESAKSGDTAAPDAELSRALVWASHDTAQVQRMTDRQIRMHQGKLSLL